MTLKSKERIMRPSVAEKIKKLTKPDPYPAFTLHCKAMGLPELTRELLFHPTRKWRFDYAFESLKIAVEIEGGIYSGGRHTRGSGFISDMEKYNEASRLGWTVYRFTPKQARSGEAATFLTKVLK